MHTYVRSLQYPTAPAGAPAFMKSRWRQRLTVAGATFILAASGIFHGTPSLASSPAVTGVRAILYGKGGADIQVSYCLTAADPTVREITFNIDDTLSWQW